MWKDAREQVGPIWKFNPPNTKRQNATVAGEDHRRFTWERPRRIPWQSASSEAGDIGHPRHSERSWNHDRQHDAVMRSREVEQHRHHHEVGRESAPSGEA